MNIADPDDLFPIDLGQAPPGLDSHEGLVAAIVGHVAPDTEPEAEKRWTGQIENDDQAEWAAGHLAAARTKITNETARYDEAVRKLDLWLADATRAAKSEAAFFEAILEHYGASRPQGRATVPLPSGKIRTGGSVEPRVEIADDAAVLAWARENAPELVKPKPVLVSELRAVVKIADGKVRDANGAEVPGAVIETPTRWVKVDT